MAIKIHKRVTINCSDDIVHGGIAISLHAVGCPFGCDHCHSKALWDESAADVATVDASDIIRDHIDRFDVGQDITVVGVGGDFANQIHEWLEFCRDVKLARPNVKISWFTGLEYSAAKLLLDVSGVSMVAAEFSFGICAIDSILWGRSVVDGMIVKNVTFAPHSKVDHNIYIPIQEL